MATPAALSSMTLAPPRLFRGRLCPALSKFSPSALLFKDRILVKTQAAFISHIRALALSRDKPLVLAKVTGEGWYPWAGGSHGMVIG